MSSANSCFTPASGVESLPYWQRPEAVLEWDILPSLLGFTVKKDPRRILSKLRPKTHEAVIEYRVQHLASIDILPFTPSGRLTNTFSTSIAQQRRKSHQQGLLSRIHVLMIS